MCGAGGGGVASGRFRSCLMGELMGYYCYLTLNMEHLIVWVEVDGVSGDVFSALGSSCFKPINYQNWTSGFTVVFFTPKNEPKMTSMYLIQIRPFVIN